MREIVSTAAREDIFLFLSTYHAYYLIMASGLFPWPCIALLSFVLFINKAKLSLNKHGLGRGESPLEFSMHVLDLISKPLNLSILLESRPPVC